MLVALGTYVCAVGSLTNGPEHINTDINAASVEIFFCFLDTTSRVLCRHGLRCSEHFHYFVPFPQLLPGALLQPQLVGLQFPG